MPSQIKHPIFYKDVFCNLPNKMYFERHLTSNIIIDILSLSKWQARGGLLILPRYLRSGKWEQSGVQSHPWCTYLGWSRTLYACARKQKYQNDIFIGITCKFNLAWNNILGGCWLHKISYMRIKSSCICIKQCAKLPW